MTVPANYGTEYSSKTLKQIFPDSQMANRFECGQTKTTAIIKTLANERATSLVNILRKNPLICTVHRWQQ